jgi:hypothetical protein
MIVGALRVAKQRRSIKRVRGLKAKQVTTPKVVSGARLESTEQSVSR